MYRTFFLVPPSVNNILKKMGTLLAIHIYYLHFITFVHCFSKNTLISIYFIDYNLQSFLFNMYISITVIQS